MHTEIVILIQYSAGPFYGIVDQITYYPDSLLFISVGLGSVRSGWTYLCPQSCYEDNRTEVYFVSHKYRATNIKIHAMLQSTTVPFVLATSPVEEWAINATYVH